jgi:general secretion pathway protein C
VNNVERRSWKAQYQGVMASAEMRLHLIWRRLARDPVALKRVQDALIILLVLWSLLSVSQLLWIPWRDAAIESAPALALNPPQPTTQNGSVAIDISGVIGSGVFGGIPDELDATSEVNEPSDNREGIERNAAETRLPLTLTGIVASTEDGLGSAVIKASGAEQVYAVGDGLPASGQVTLAKVMPKTIVIDNNGTYELLKLYEDAGLVIPTTASKEVRVTPAERAVTVPRPETRAPVASEAERSKVAQRYRRALYETPEALASLLTVSPVQTDGTITGYRISPSKERAAFDALGFQTGDVVTAVNGLSLSDTTNTMKLYTLMKKATEASFDITREGGNVTISVDLTTR